MSKSWRPATQLVHGGTTRSQHGETAEAIFLTQGFVYDTSAAAAGSRPAHSALLAAGIPIVEHLTNLGAVPARGARFTAVPPKVAGFGTFPVRAFALVP